MTFGVLTVLFWNLGGNAPLESIGRIVDSWSVDVAAFAEAASADEGLRHSMGRLSLARIPSTCGALTVCARPSARAVQRFAASRYAVVSVEQAESPEILLGYAHLPSGLHSDEYGRAAGCREFARAVRRVEREREHTRTVVLGDLNMDPFDRAVVAADGLHGVMTRERARKQGRTVDGRQWPFFYNPMWSRMGDASPGPAGTYHYARGAHECRFWHTFDQALIRPALLDAFRSDDLVVLTEDGVQSLLTPSGYPHKTRLSDHLPVVLRLRF